MHVQPRDSYVKLSTVEAARVLGVSRKTTNRMCQGTYPLPDGWTFDKEQRAQGERWVLFCPPDDPRLAQLGTNAPVTTGGVLAPPAPPSLGAIETLLDRLTDLGHERQGDWQLIATQQESIGRLRGESQQLALRLTDRDRELARALGDRGTAEARVRELTAEVERLRDILQRPWWWTFCYAWLRLLGVQRT